MCKIMRKLADVKLEPDERLALMDSGAFCNAIDAETELPGAEIIPLAPSERGRDGESASGGILKRLGKVSTLGSVDGTELNLRWNVMKVTVPIISVRKLAKDKWNASFRENDGFLKHRETKARIPFFEHKGVYYVKYRVTGINGKKGELKAAGFARQEP